MTKDTRVTNEAKATEGTNGTSAAPFVESLKIACYAATGGRKTLQIGHLIDTFGAENVGIISCEHGLSTITSLVDPRFVYTAKALKGEAESMRGAWAWAKKNFSGPNQWVCVDGGSRVLEWVRQDIFGGAQVALEAIMDGSSKKGLDPEVRPYAAFITKDEEFNTQPMWIRVAADATRLFDSFVALGSSMYWTFWEEQTSVDQYRKGDPWKPDTPGKGTFNALRGCFDFIVRLLDQGDSCAGVLQSTPRSYAKKRDDWRGGIKLPPTVDNFNLAELVRVLRGDLPLTTLKPLEPKVSNGTSAATKEK